MVIDSGWGVVHIILKMFAEYFLSSVTLGKGFTKCNITFAECLIYSANKASLSYCIVSRFTNFIMWTKSCICASGGPHGVCPVMM
jgi:hypothetical protein